jgi:lysozyme
MLQALRIATESVKLEETFSPRAYRDRGRLAIGYGWNVEREPMTREAADVLLAQMLDRMALEVLEELPWTSYLSPVRQAVLVEMRYQLGLEGLKGFTEFLKAAKAGDWERAAAEMLDSKWHREDTPARAKKLAKRFLEDRF